MKKENVTVKKENGFFEGRAVMTLVVAATAFLCFFTAFEIFLIKMEWNLPVMNAFIGGSDNYIFSHYREEEEKLELSAENEPKETEWGELSYSENENTEYEPDEQKSMMEMTEATEQEDNVVFDEESETTENTEVIIQAEEEVLPYYIKINRKQNVITVYKKDDGDNYTIPIRAIVCSTGLYNATPKGVFHLSNKYIWRELNGGVYGQYASRITGGVLFHSVPYASKNKSTLYWDKYNKLGQQASMGCVRLTVEDAKWIYDNCPSGTTVEVYESEDPGPLGKPETIKLDKDNANKGWDPTDPDEANPWHAWSEDG